MSLLDATFLHVETPETPMHVAGLQIFRRPPGADAGFVRAIVDRYRDASTLAAPFDLKLSGGLDSKLAPRLVPAGDIDMEYHVRHTCLPAPGGERELGELTSHLHGVLLDRSRPLWTCHVIDGLSDDRFAVYFKVHHALTDGVGGMKLIQRAMASTPDGAWCAPWQQHPVVVPLGVRREPKPRTQALRELAELPVAVVRSVAGFVRSRGSEPVRLPFEAPPSVLNSRVTAARRVATQQLPLERVQNVAAGTGTSVNDVFLAICGAAIRRHVQEWGELPGRSMIAGVPVSLRQEGDTDANCVGFVWATLGTDIEDPRARLAVVNASMRASKNQLRAVSPRARKTLTMATMLPVIGVLMSGLGDRLRAPMNVTISNVPGPRSTAYVAGARLEALYPISVPFQGQGLNITCVTYDGQFNIGFTGARDSVPHLQRLAGYAADALAELEATLEVAERKRTRAKQLV
jgi:WS/DGAT/MGAT family acyltransferase